MRERVDYIAHEHCCPQQASRVRTARERNDVSTPDRGFHVFLVHGRVLIGLVLTPPCCVVVTPRHEQAPLSMLLCALRPLDVRAQRGGTRLAYFHHTFSVAKAPSSSSVLTPFVPRVVLPLPCWPLPPVSDGAHGCSFVNPPLTTQTLPYPTQPVETTLRELRPNRLVEEHIQRRISREVDSSRNGRRVPAAAVVERPAPAPHASRRRYC